MEFRRGGRDRKLFLAKTFAKIQNAGVWARLIPVCRSPVLGEAICRVPKFIFARGGVCGTTALLGALLRLAGGIARAGFTCRLRARIHADFVRIIIILLQIAYFPLHVKNDHILLKSALR